ncbi:MAG: ribonuclease Z [Atribacterota bacterium]|nr:ribonuclease Z [Atribacterota bacterium]
MMNKVVFLGTGAGMPTISRNVSSLALILNKSGDFFLFDCGEGTQQQLRKTQLKISKLKAIFISHLHGDHLFGLPGLLATRGLEGHKEPLQIFGPVGLEEYLEKCFYYSRTHIPYCCKIRSISKENFLGIKLLNKIQEYFIFCAYLNHQIDSFGYSVIEQKIKKNIIVERLTGLGIKPGPIYKEIKEQKEIVLSNGEMHKTDNFMKKIIKIKKFCYCCDTSFSENAVVLAQNADLLVHEATFLECEKSEAERSFHSTIKDAVRIAKEARVKNLALTHISSRYSKTKKNNSKNYHECINEEKKDFPSIILAEDLLEIDI